MTFGFECVDVNSSPQTIAWLGMGLVYIIGGWSYYNGLLSDFDLLGLYPGRFVARVRWASELIDTSLALRDLGCPHSLTIATPSGGRSAPVTRAAGGGRP